MPRELAKGQAPSDTSCGGRIIHTKERYLKIVSNRTEGTRSGQRSAVRACSVALPCSSLSAFSLFLNPLELKLDLDRWDCSRRSACQQVFTEFRQRQQLGRAVDWEMLRSNTVQSVHGMLQQKRSMAAP